MVNDEMVDWEMVDGRLSFIYIIFQLTISSTMSSHHQPSHLPSHLMSFVS